MNYRFTSYFVARAVILAGLLSGLLFSSGEGVHLFPFPAYIAAADLVPKANGGEKIEYQENAQRVEKNKERFQTRFQRGQENWKGAFNSTHKFPARPQFTALRSNRIFDLVSFRSQHFTVPISGRPPPVS